MKKFLLISFVLFVSVKSIAQIDSSLIYGLDITGFVDVTAQEANISIQKINLKIIDLRSADEFYNGHLNHAINWYYTDGSFTKHIIKQNHHKTFLIYADSRDGISDSAMDDMEQLGFENVLNMNEGIHDWIENKLPVVK